MKINESIMDRGIRVVLGLSILSLAFFGPQTAWGYLGVIPLVTGIIGYCPLYSLMGYRSCSVIKSRKSEHI